MSGIYMLTFPDRMQYIGQAVDIKRRWSSHKSGHGHSWKVQEWVKKFGWNDVHKEVLVQCRPEEMNALEIDAIAEHNTLWPNGLNILPGGEAPSSEYVKQSWTDPEVRKRHTEGRVRAWADPEKRARIMAGREASEKVQAAKIAKKQNSAEANAKRTETWEAKREARLEGLTPEQRAKRIARMDRQRDLQRAIAAAKRLTSSRSRPSCEQQEEDESMVPSDYEDGEGPPGN